MPNRILKESICTSASIDALSPFQEIFYYRLIVNVDDYGRMDARIPILRSRLFPLKQIEDAEICAALAALRVQELLQVYQVNKGIYLQLCNWERHQTVRAKKSKCPAPDGNWLTLENICKQMQADDLCKQTKANDFKCEQAQANVPVIQSNPIQFESYSRERNAPAPTREKKSFGSFENVMLTEEEHNKLAELPNGNELIERFSKKLAAKGYHYENHYAAILCWQAEDHKETKDDQSDEYWDSFFELACQRPEREKE